MSSISNSSSGARTTGPAGNQVFLDQSSVLEHPSPADTCMGRATVQPESDDFPQANGQTQTAVDMGALGDQHGATGAQAQPQSHLPGASLTATASMHTEQMDAACKLDVMVDAEGGDSSPGGKEPGREVQTDDLWCVHEDVCCSNSTWHVCMMLAGNVACKPMSRTWASHAWH